MRRELKALRTGNVIGAVDDRAGPVFEGAAADVLQALRVRLGDEETVGLVMDQGWSNGYLFFDEPVDEGVLVAAAAVHTGAMVALVPSEADADRLAVAGGEPADQLHVTLAYLGEAAALTPETQAAILDRVGRAGADRPPVAADGFALNLFNPTNAERDTCIVLGLSGDDLANLHSDVTASVEEALLAAGQEMPDQHQPWVPHLTLIYTDDADQLAELVDRTGPVTFDRLRVAFGGDLTDIPLEAAMTTPALLPAAADMATGTGGEYGVAVAAPGVEHFHTIVMEGVSTGLRTFAQDSLTWRETPFAFHYEYSSAAHGGQMMTAQVGVITRAQREAGGQIHFWGALDLADPMALEYARKLVTGFTRWSSIGLDESLKDADVELIFPDEQADDDPLALLFGDPEQIIFHKGRIAEITAVSVPALADATVEPMQALVDALGAMGVLTTGEPPPAAEEGDTLTAAGYTITIPDLPPAEWFTEPTDAPAIGALTITDEGRVYGWLAPAGVTHRAFRGQRAVFAPRGIDFSEFANKTALAVAADGTTVRIAAGNVTMSCEHASPVDPRRADPGWAAQHYENTCSIFARIAVGETADGTTWVGGALLPDVSWQQVTRALGCALSGDWQGGKLKAALLVPVEGFPTAHHASVRVTDGVLVSSAVPVRFRRHATPDLRPVLEAIARRLGRDSMSRLAELRGRHPSGKATS